MLKLPLPIERHPIGPVKIRPGMLRPGDFGAETARGDQKGGDYDPSSNKVQSHVVLT